MFLNQFSLEDGFDAGAGGTAGAEDAALADSAGFAASFDSAGFASEDVSELGSELFEA